jgi:hypothetical protein
VEPTLNFLRCVLVQYPALVYTFSYWQLTQFHITFYFTLKYMIFCIKVSAKIANRIYEHVYHTIYSNVILKSNYTVFNAVPPTGWIEIVLTATTMIVQWVNRNELRTCCHVGMVCCYLRWHDTLTTSQRNSCSNHMLVNVRWTTLPLCSIQFVGWGETESTWYVSH